MSIVGYESETDSISSGCCAGLSGSCAASEKADLKNYNGSATYQEIPHCTTEMQGYDVEFEPPLESKYECPICLMALREAVQTPCGHRFCKGCILQSIRDAGQKCPVDNEILLENQLFPDNFAKREILSLTVRCPNKGCEQRMELRKLDTHTSQCLYATVPCRDCNKQVRRSHMNEHMANQCLRRLIICPNCAGSIIFEEAKTHEEECPLANVMCEYCSTELIREQLKSHCDMDCPKAPVLCTFSSFGCPEKMQRDKLAQHMQEYTQMHMHFMAMSLRSLSLTTPSHMGPILQSDSSEFHFDPAPPLTGPCTMASPISASGATGGQTPSHCDCDQNRQHLQETIHQLESRLVRQDHQIRELTAKMETQSGLVGDLKRQVRVLEEKVNELEAQQFNGIYIWKIENFSAFLRTQEADQPVVIHSPGFYTGRPGYKLCLRLHLQTPSVPRCANYISLFVHTMQGIYDSQLPWPFQGTIRLSILDQTEGPVQQNHEEVMETKPDLLAFQRPSMPRNPKGFGYVTFMHLQALRQREYIRDDTLLVRCDVTPRIDLSCIRREGFQPRGLESSM